MKLKILLIAFVFDLFTAQLFAQYETARNPLNMTDNTLMNHESYIPFGDKMGGEGVYMWPNPAKGKTMVYVNSLKQRDQGKCMLYNLNGKVFLYKQINNGTNIIDFGNVPAGMYVLKIVGNDRFQVTRQLIVSQ
ncbi:MAG: T9SS type A sorting domain-containing protein [Ilyomonas sp.]